MVWHVTGNTNGALMCSLVQVVRVVIVRVILVGVRGVTVVHIDHDEVLVVVLKSVAIFVVIFCIWRCTLYTKKSEQKKGTPRLGSSWVEDLLEELEWAFPREVHRGQRRMGKELQDTVKN